MLYSTHNCKIVKRQKPSEVKYSDHNHHFINGQVVEEKVWRKLYFINGQVVEEEKWLTWYKAQLEYLKLIRIREPKIKTPIPYQELRVAWASMISEILNAFTWSWWITLTSKKPMPLEIIRGRFYKWLKRFRKILGHGFEVFWIIERQRRGALHVHAVISNVPTDDKKFWRAMINTWEYYWTHGAGEKFGSATVVKYDPMKAGKLSNYLAKERCKDLDLLEGSGSIFEKMGYSRRIKKFLNNSSSFKTTSRKSFNVCANSPEDISAG